MESHHFVEIIHQYEDPDEMTKIVRRKPEPPPPRKSWKKEPTRMKIKERNTNAPEFSNGWLKDRCSNFVKILAFAGFVIALAALIVAVMLMLGIGSTPVCKDSSENGIASLGSEEGGDRVVEDLWKIFNKLTTYNSELSSAMARKDDLISQLQNQSLHYTKKMARLVKIDNYLDVFAFKKSTLKHVKKIARLADDLISAFKNITSCVIGNGQQKALSGTPALADRKNDDRLGGLPGKPERGNSSLRKGRRQENSLVIRSRYQRLGLYVVLDWMKEIFALFVFKFVTSVFASLPLLNN